MAENRPSPRGAGGGGFLWVTQLSTERSDPSLPHIQPSFCSGPVGCRNAHNRQPIAMQNMQPLLHRSHHLKAAPPPHWLCFVPRPLMRVIFVPTKETETVSKHNSHGASYYKILACTVGGGPVIVARGENSHKETKLGRNSRGRLMMFWCGNTKQGFIEHNSRNN